jgi:hypothetical protein
VAAAKAAAEGRPEGDPVRLVWQLQAAKERLVEARKEFEVALEEKQQQYNLMYATNTLDCSQLLSGAVGAGWRRSGPRCLCCCARLHMQ